jgi:DNA-binding MarR family transcriptional regulator
MELQPGMEFFDTLVRYETYLWNHLDRRLADEGEVALSTLFALRVIRRHAGDCRVQDLRADLGVTVGAASKLVDRLERDGLAVRSPHPHDRRSSLIALSPAGEAAHDRGVALLDAALAEHVSPEAGIGDVTGVLRRLMSALDAPTAEVAR